MAKIYGINGVLTGKLGSAVYAIRNGEQIVRQYNPSPLNPKSDSQIEARAKLKLLSQLSANYAKIIAIKRKGDVTGRNLFLKRNYQFAGYDKDEAFVTLADVQLTNSSVSLAGFTVDRSGDNMSLELSQSMGNTIDRVVYVIVKKSDNQELLIVDSKVVELGEGGGTFPTTMTKVTGELVVMAYGIRLNNEAARISFGNLVAPSAQEVARLLVTMKNAETAVTLTETRGLQLAQNENSGATSGDLRVSIIVAVSSASTGSGTVSGGGRVATGESVELVATPSSESEFRGWYTENNTVSASTLYSRDTTVNYTAGETSVTLYAVFGIQG